MSSCWFLHVAIKMFCEWWLEFILVRNQYYYYCNYYNESRNQWAASSVRPSSFPPPIFFDSSPLCWTQNHNEVMLRCWCGRPRCWHAASYSLVCSNVCFVLSSTFSRLSSWRSHQKRLSGFGHQLWIDSACLTATRSNHAVTGAQTVCQFFKQRSTSSSLTVAEFKGAAKSLKTWWEEALVEGQDWILSSCFLSESTCSCCNRTTLFGHRATSREDLWRRHVTFIVMWGHIQKDSCPPQAGLTKPF